MAGIEIISGKRGKQYIGVSRAERPCGVVASMFVNLPPLQRMMDHIDEKYFQRWFCRPTRRSHLTELFEELAMTYD